MDWFGKRYPCNGVLTQWSGISGLLIPRNFRWLLSTSMRATVHGWQRFGPNGSIAKSRQFASYNSTCRQLFSMKRKPAVWVTCCGRITPLAFRGGQMTSPRRILWILFQSSCAEWVCTACYCVRHLFQNHGASFLIGSAKRRCSC